MSLDVHVVLESVMSRYSRYVLAFDSFIDVVFLVTSQHRRYEHFIYKCFLCQAISYVYQSCTCQAERECGNNAVAYNSYTDEV